MSRRKIVSYRYFAGGAYTFTNSDRKDTVNGHGSHVAVSMSCMYKIMSFADVYVS